MLPPESDNSDLSQPTKTSRLPELPDEPKTERPRLRATAKDIIAAETDTRRYLVLENADEIDHSWEELSPETEAKAPKTMSEVIGDQMKVYKKFHARVMQTGMWEEFVATVKVGNEDKLLSFKLFPFQQDGHTMGVVTRVEDASKLEESALKDPLTGLDSKLKFDEDFRNITLDAQRVEASQRPPISVILIDTNDFKWVNDNLGHPVGDDALRKIAKIIREEIRPSDPASRYGGDEFRIVLEGADMKVGVEAAERIRARVNDEIEVGEGDKKRKLSLSIGVALLPLNGDNTPLLKTTKELSEKDLSHTDDMIERAVKAADTASFVAKEKSKAEAEKNKGRNVGAVAAYTEDMVMPEARPRNFTPLEGQGK